MTENETIEKLHAYLECESRRAKIVSCNENCDDCELCYMQGTGSEHIASVEVAIKALEEVQQYRQIGTVEECREAVEKQTAKKVTSFDYHNGTVNYGCPICKRKIISKIDGEWCGGTFNEYCDRCGQKLDWSDGDGN